MIELLYPALGFTETCFMRRKKESIEYKSDMIFEDIMFLFTKIVTWYWVQSIGIWSRRVHDGTWSTLVQVKVRYQDQDKLTIC